MIELEESSDSEPETQYEELEQLRSLIDKESIDDYPPSTSAINIDVEDSTECRIIEAAIEYNIVMSEKLKRLENLFTQRLIECREKLNAKPKPSTSVDKTKPIPPFRYLRCGMPYFKDKSNHPAPNNSDTILMNSSGMYSHYLHCIKRCWPIKDKINFNVLMLNMSKKLKRDEVRNAMANLDIDNPKLLKVEMEKYERILNSIDKMSLKQLALPIDEDYDWHYVANKLDHRRQPEEYAALWKLFLHPSINTSQWTDREQLMLQDIVRRDKEPDWEDVAKEINTGRTGYQCFVKHRANSIHFRQISRWTKDEDEYLKKLVDFYREGSFIPWTRIASYFETRNKSQVYSRWICTSVVKKGRFMPEEDAVLLTCVNKFGPDFKKVLKYIKGRNVSQLKARYNTLRQSCSAQWTAEEDQKLVELMGTFNTYSEIVDSFPGKSRTNLRVRHITLKRWLKANPSHNLALAPRRGAFSLVHGKPTATIDIAVEKLNEKLNEKLENQNTNKVCNNRKNRTTKPHTEVDLAIIEFLYEEQSQKDNICELSKVKSYVLDRGDAPDPKPESLQKIQILLRATLDRAKVEASQYAEQYKRQPQIGETKRKVFRSYSKKETVDRPCKIVPSFHPDVWGTTLDGDIKFVLPPTYQTLIGCKTLLSSLLHSSTFFNKNLSAMCKGNPLIMTEYTHLLQRLKLIFLWPLRLSYLQHPRFR